MQNWKIQAEKNHLKVVSVGGCQLCGSSTTKGLPECIEKSAHIPYRLHHADSVQSMTLFLCVDAFALQHPEIQGPWSIHLHLSRLHLILLEKIQWVHAFTPLLSQVLDLHKRLGEQIHFVSPKPKNRGAITITDVESAASDQEYISLIQAWAFNTYKQFESGHEIAMQLSKSFMAKLSKR